MHPEACPSGFRHGGGAKLNQALVRNVRNLSSDAKGEIASGSNREDQSTDAECGAQGRSSPYVAQEVSRRYLEPYLEPTPTLMATGPADLRSMAFAKPVSAAGDTTECSTSASRGTSTASIGS
jgi:hypothetical protein